MSNKEDPRKNNFGICFDSPQSQILFACLSRLTVISRQTNLDWLDICVLILNITYDSTYVKKTRLALSGVIENIGKFNFIYLITKRFYFIY